MPCWGIESWASYKLNYQISAPPAVCFLLVELFVLPCVLLFSFLHESRWPEWISLSSFFGQSNARDQRAAVLFLSVCWLLAGDAFKGFLLQSGLAVLYAAQLIFPAFPILCWIPLPAAPGVCLPHFGRPSSMVTPGK